MERADIQQWTRSYLQKLLQYEAEGREIYYLDESYIHTGSSAVNSNARIIKGLVGHDSPPLGQVLG